MKSFNAVRAVINSAVLASTGAAAYFGIGYFFPTLIGWMFWAATIGSTILVAGLLMFVVAKFFPATKEA